MNEQEIEAKFRSTHEMVSRLIKYPPFSTDTSLWEDIQEEISNLPPVGEPINYDVLNSYYEPILSKFAEQVEEASLWQSRYPLDRYEAAYVALTLDGLSESEIELRLLSI